MVIVECRFLDRREKGHEGDVNFEASILEIVLENILLSVTVPASYCVYNRFVLVVVEVMFH